jgi:hypothetical protein
MKEGRFFRRKWNQKFSAQAQVRQNAIVPARRAFLSKNGFLPTSVV